MNGNLAYRDPPREELIDGKIVAMSPRPRYNHNKVASKIYRRFANYLENSICEAIADGTDLYLDEKNRFVPDMMVVCDRSKIKWDGVHGAPDLVVEVLSPGTARNDRTHKMDVYARFGVQEYWIADPEARTIEQYFLQDGKFVANEFYTFYQDYELESMDEEERKEVVTHFKCSLYDDFEISLEDIFYGMIE